MSVGHSRVRRRITIAVAAIGLLIAGAGLSGAARSNDVAGPAGDGTAVTPLGMRVTPAGAQTGLGDLPLNAALSPDGRWLLVSNDGQAVQSLQLVDTGSGQVVQTLRYPSPEALYIGLAWSADGQHVYGGTPFLLREVCRPRFMAAGLDARPSTASTRIASHEPLTATGAHVL